MNIGFIGTGNMGGAILKGYMQAAGAGDTVYAFRRDKEKLAALCEETGAVAAESIRQAAAVSDLLFLGVKPQNFDEILPAVKAGLDDRAEQAAADGKASPVIVSMAAGITIRYLEEALGGGTKIVRIMPNTPALIGCGMISTSRNANVTDEDMAKAVKVLTPCGKTCEVPEDLIHTVIGVSGSSPAYTYMYIEALMKAAVKHGMDEESAKLFAAQAVLGAAAMVLSQEDSPEQLRINVCSPGGTTIEAVNKLFEKDFPAVVEEAFDAAVAKSRAMSGE